MTTPLTDAGLSFSVAKLKALMGYTEWPDEGVDGFIIDDVMIRVAPRNPYRKRYHRAYTRCPKCNEWFSYGRFHQHYAIHKEQ